VEIVSRIAPSLLFGQDVIDFDVVTIHEVPTAGSTSPLLLLPEPGDARWYMGMASEASAPVQPVSVIGATCALHFHIALVWCVVVTSQGLRTVCGLEAPALSIVHSPVFARNPMFRFLGMTGDSPSPQHRIHRVVEPLKGACAADMGIVRTPANDRRIEGVDQRLLLRVSMAVYRLSQSLDMPLHRCRAGGDARCEAVQTSSAIFARLGLPPGVLSDLKAEKVATRSPLGHVQRMGDPCFAWLQR